MTLLYTFTNACTYSFSSDSFVQVFVLLIFNIYGHCFFNCRYLAICHVMEVKISRKTCKNTSHRVVFLAQFTYCVKWHQHECSVPVCFPVCFPYVFWTNQQRLNKNARNNNASDKTSDVNVTKRPLTFQLNLFDVYYNAHIYPVHTHWKDVLIWWCVKTVVRNMYTMYWCVNKIQLIDLHHSLVTRSLHEFHHLFVFCFELVFVCENWIVSSAYKGNWWLKRLE